MRLVRRIRPPLRLLAAGGAVAVVGLAAVVAVAAFGPSGGAPMPTGAQLVGASQPAAAPASPTPAAGGPATTSGTVPAEAQVTAQPQATTRATPFPNPATTAVASTSPSPSPSATARTSARTTPSPTPDLAWHVPVLMYHLIATPEESRDALYELVVSPKLFANQMLTLHAAGWHTITASELGEALASDQRPPARTFVITIDDGYVDGYEEALPILQGLSFTASFYVPTGRIGWSRILTRQQITEMDAAGMEIGDHSASHADLTLLSLADAWTELVDSAEYLDTLLGERPDTFAYPFGTYNPDVIELVDAAGFSIAFTTKNGCRETHDTRFATQRLAVGPTMTAARLLAAVEACNG